MRVDASGTDLQLQANQKVKSKEHALEAQISNAMAEQPMIKSTQVNNSANEAIKEVQQGESDEG
ncbi:hypothetical protein [uncultured Nitratireductor sp.]|uniref:hypothetical protein n=1 Tax=uncultured Nitratireductor sp. TaxID=520953 RepID=UPI0025E11079|nr:hypothetical protein [uncultured Nitratireductor sp.]